MFGLLFMAGFIFAGIAFMVVSLFVHMWDAECAKLYGPTPGLVVCGIVAILFVLLTIGCFVGSYLSVPQCPDCNVRTLSSFCEQCGEAVNVDPTCPECSRAVNPASHYCPDCGAEISD